MADVDETLKRQPHESLNRYRARKRAARERVLKEPLPPPFEHLPGQFWVDVINTLEEKGYHRKGST